MNASVRWNATKTIQQEAFLASVNLLAMTTCFAMVDLLSYLLSSRDDGAISERGKEVWIDQRMDAVQEKEWNDNCLHYNTSHIL